MGHCAGNVHYMNVRKPVIPLSKADVQLMQRSAGLVRSGSVYPNCALVLSAHSDSELTALIGAQSVLQTRELVTGSPASERGYFRLHLNQYQAVETITCVSKEVRFRFCFRQFAPEGVLEAVVLIHFRH